MRLMCDFELDFSIVEKKFNIEFTKYFAAGISGLKDFLDEGLVKIENNVLTVTKTGQLLIRNIAMNFDGYIERKEDTGRYSKTV